jgi:hypothetical protein
MLGSDRPTDSVMQRRAVAGGYLLQIMTLHSLIAHGSHRRFMHTISAVVN